MIEIVRSSDASEIIGPLECPTLEVQSVPQGCEVQYSKAVPDIFPRRGSRDMNLVAGIAVSGPVMGYGQNLSTRLGCRSTSFLLETIPVASLVVSTYSIRRLSCDT